MAEKLIPGIPFSTRIAILQQTDAEIGQENEEIGKVADELRENKLFPNEEEKQKTALEQVIFSDTARTDLQRRINCWSIFVDQYDRVVQANSSLL